MTGNEQPRSCQLVGTMGNRIEWVWHSIPPPHCHQRAGCPWLHSKVAGVVLLSPEGDQIECMVRLDFPTTNNEVEYEALVVGLDLANAIGAARVVLYCDSQVVTNQVNGDYKCRGERMKRYLDQVRRRVDELKAKIIQIPKREKEQANHLAKSTSTKHMSSRDNVLSFVHLSPLIDFLNV